MIGVAVAGVPKDGDLDHDVGLFVPVVGIRSLLEAHRGSAPARGTGVPPVDMGWMPMPRRAPFSPREEQSSKPAAVCGEFLPPVIAASSAAPHGNPDLSGVAPPSTAPAATPVVAEAKAPSGNTAPPAEAAATKTGPPEYVIQQGDNLTRIARQLNVPLDALVRANQLREPNRLWVGSRLVVPE